VTPSWTLGILAGGFSRRMGTDKARLDIGGRTLLDRVVERFAPPGTPVLVGTRPGGPCSEGPHRCSFDIVSGEGPLASVAALVRDCETTWLLVLPCDLPLLPPDMGPRMLEQAADSEAVFLGVEGTAQPFPMLLASSAAGALLRLFESGERRAIAIKDCVPAVVVPWERIYAKTDPREAFVNVNDPESFAKYLRIAGR
jgi:molybdopterin-guanine dinucleotide biosynthesis protein A